MPFVDLTFLLSIALLLYAAWPGHSGRSRWTGRLLALSLLSPLLRYGSALFMFPIRLQLSAWAGALLRGAGLPVQVTGNVLLKNGVEMAVDPACMGLQMTGISVLVAVFVLIWHEHLHQQAVPAGWVAVYGIVVAGLTILCNLFRIVLLVLFESMPGTVAHEAIGLVCVAVYAWLPAWWLARLLVHVAGKPDPVSNTYSGTKSVGWGLGLLLAGSVMLLLFSRPVTASGSLSQAAAKSLANWSGSDLAGKQLPNGFVQLSRPGVLIYVKPQPDWISADHSPMACWQGSGYQLRLVRESTVNGHPAYVGELRKGHEVLHTAWWFSNGVTITVSQLQMRRHMLLGKPAFALVNITTSKPFNPSATSL